MDAFSHRAPTYDAAAWHVRYAERLVALARVPPGSHVLDAATGTGHAARAAARTASRVTAVDISPAMLARAVVPANVEVIQADATSLPGFPDASFDVILCSAGLLYMPVRKALGEWHRLLAPAGRLGFSTMHEGSPRSAALFRTLAASYGLRLTDPAAPLGTPDRCRQALTAAGFRPTDLYVEELQFSAADLAHAFHAHAHGPHPEVLISLSAAQLADFKTTYEKALTSTEATVIYAFATAAG